MQYSIVKHSQVKNSPDLRMDGEYWRPAFIQNSLLFSSQQKIVDFVDHNIQNIKSSPINRAFEYLEISRISLNSCEYQSIRVEAGSEPDRAHHILQKEDVVISTVRPNRNAVAFIQKDGIVGSSGLAVLRTKKVEPAYLFAFCKTDYFVKCLMRANKTSMYPAVSKKDVLETPFFIPSDDFRSGIVWLVEEALLRVNKASLLFNNAQSLLLAELGLTDWQPKHQLTFIKNYSDTKKSDRIDAGHYQPKYDELIDAIKGCSGGWDTLENLVSISKGLEVGRKEYLNEGIPFIRVSNLNLFGITEAKYISESLYAELKQHQPKRGEILLSKDATPGIAYYLDEVPKRMIPASGILRLKNITHKVNNEFLTLALNSIVVKEQVNREGGGFIITHWQPEQVKGTLIPILPVEIQTAIQRKVTESFDLRRQSKRLLECAKRAVEIAIEQDEPAAVAWLDRAALI